MALRFQCCQFDKDGGVLEETNMRNLMWVGVLLVTLGLLGLVVPSVNFTETKKVIDLGPLQVNSTEQHKVPIPTIAAIVAVLAGLGVIVASRRQA
jgi:uncharacterized membrane protein YidH (DUF202 family)